MEEIQTHCCIVGGGPAGIILGYLLASAGVDVTVVEKHADFFRDFRGDTVHPSTLELINQMGLLDDFLKIPHQKVFKFRNTFDKKTITFADFSSLNVTAPYIAMMPQWDFLDFFAEQAKKYTNFKLLMNNEAVDIDISEKSIITVNQNNNKTKITANLIVAADGRHSTLRKLLNLKINEFGAPIDVLWFRLSKKASDPDETGARFIPGNIMVMINRKDYWQCAYIIAKGSLDIIKQQGLEFFKKKLINNVGFLVDRVDEIQTWDDVKLLTVKVDRLSKWYVDNSVLLIGDAAHAMSPVGGVGINLAIQDAVAAYNILKQPLLDLKVSTSDLQRVQRRRELPVKIIQKIQLILHDRVINKVMTVDDSNQNQQIKLPFFIKLLSKFKFLNKVTAYLIGIGVRSEKIS